MDRRSSLEYTIQQLGKLNTASQRVLELRTREELYREVPNIVTDELGFERVFFNLEQDGRLMLRGFRLRDATLEESEAFLASVRSDDAPPPPWIRQCFDSGEAMLITEGAVNEGHRGIGWPKSLVLAPIVVEGVTTGVLLGTLGEEDRDADQEDLERFSTFTNMIALALANIQAYEGLERKVEERTLSLREAQAQLVQSEKMASLGMLVAGVAHELNTPAGAIHSMRDTLQRASDKLATQLQAAVPDPEAFAPIARTLRAIESATRVVEDGTNRIAEIVRRLRAFAKLDEAELQRVDLHQGLDDTLEMLRDADHDRVEVVKRYGQLPAVECFPGRLNQVFLNLLVNARQAIADRGTITLETRHDGDQVSVAIRDTGSGIAADDLSRIFDPGYTTKGVKVGTGLGLSICFRIVEDHGGRIEVTSTPGEGSTFTVHLPVRGLPTAG